MEVKKKSGSGLLLSFIQPLSSPLSSHREEKLYDVWSSNREKLLKKEELDINVWEENCHKQKADFKILCQSCCFGSNRINYLIILKLNILVFELLMKLYKHTLSEKKVKILILPVKNEKLYINTPIHSIMKNFYYYVIIWPRTEGPFIIILLSKSSSFGGFGPPWILLLDDVHVWCHRVRHSTAEKQNKD